MILYILAGVAAAVALFALFVASRPAKFHVERSITVAAPPERLFAQVNDFHAWAAWSPYEKLDPQLKKTFEGAASGDGAIYTWTGNDKAGEGKMTIEKSEPPSRLSIKLEFRRPFAATNTATFSFASAPAGTKVTWAVDGHNGFAAKAVSLFMNMDQLVGKDFERGLVALKTVTEGTSTVRR